MLYCITVKNAGGTAADDVTIADDIPANTTFFDDAANTYVDVDPTTAIRIGSSDSCDRADWNAAVAGAEDQDAIGGDELPNGGNYNPAGNGTVTTTVDVLPANNGTVDGITTTMFMVEID